MTTGGPARVGWCPGALRPMATGDGLLVRVKPRGGVLSIDAAAVIADLAVRHGNGTLDLTARANLQIRGVSDASHEPLLRGLDALGLVDADPDAEAVRNVVASPVAGLDGRELADVTPIVAALEAMLLDARDLWRLPAKWSFVVDGGGPLNLRGVSADIRFEARPGGTFAVSLAADSAYAVCRPEQVARIAADLCRFALEASPGRMREAVRERGSAGIFPSAGLALAGEAAPRTPTVVQDVIGPRTYGGGHALGVAPPFATMKAPALRDLAMRAGRHGAHALRLTPWRAVLVPGLGEDAAVTLRDALPAADWIAAPDDPRLAIAACSGAPACPRGTTPVPAHAARLAETLRTIGSHKGIAIHVSGCAKGCAHPHRAPITLVARDGLYDLVLDGKAGDKPSAYGLPLDTALRRIGADPS